MVSPAAGEAADSLHFLRLTELLFQDLTVGHVIHDRLNGRSAVDGQRHAGHFDDDMFLVRPVQAQLPSWHRRAALLHSCRAPGDDLLVVPPHQLEDRPPNQIRCRGRAQQLGAGAIGEHHDAVPMDDQAIGEVIDE